jgi:HEAT repeat protein
MAGAMAVAVVLPASGVGQPADDHAVLSRAYTALSAGRAAEAESLAAQILSRQPRHHAAAVVAVEAASSRDARAGLSVYEKWLSAVRHEDAFTLEPVALAVVRALAKGKGSAADEAGRLLAELGGDAVSRPAAEAADERGRELASQLADADGANRLLTLRALVRTGYVAASPQVVPLLGHDAPDVRAAAAEALGALGAADAVPALQAALKDPASEVRSAAAVALHRLGDPAGDELLGRLLTSGIPDLQLQAAEGMLHDPPSAWAPYVEPLLQADAPMTRLGAARLLLEVDPERAGSVIGTLLADPNPVVVGELARALVVEGLRDLATIRKLLAHQSPDARFQGALALLRLTGAVI